MLKLNNLPLLLRCLSIFIIAVTVFYSCGDKNLDTEIRAKVAAKNIPMATESNIADWWNAWDKKTLLVGVNESEGLQNAQAILDFKHVLGKSILSSFFAGYESTVERWSEIQTVFVDELNLERYSLITDNDVAKNESSDSITSNRPRQQAGIYFVKLDSIAAAFRAVTVRGIHDFNRGSLSLSDPVGLVRLMQIVGATHGVEWVEPNLITNFPKVKKSDHLESSSFGLAPEFKYNTAIVSVLKRIRADSAFAYVEKLKSKLMSVVVAVLDTGVDSAHPELKDQMFVNPGETQDGIDNDNNCFVDDIHGIDATVECGRDDGVIPRPGHADLGGPGKQCPRVRSDDELSANCGHGSHVAGIIAAKHGGDLSTIGVCPSCKILSIRVAERCLQPATNDAGECRKPMTAYDPLSSYEVDGGISDASQVRALAYLYNLRAPDNRNRLLVNIVNLSLGKYFASRAMSYIIRNLQRKNIIVVAAAGNDGTETPSYPAAYDSVVAVCATSEDYARGVYGRAPFSNFGDWVDICAPGTDIVSTTPGKTFDGGGLFVDKSGTSQATPFVAGALGYLLSVYGNEKSAAQVVEILKNAADSENLYNSQSNRVPGTGERLYRACYADTSNCDNLLGAGFLDLDAAVQGKQQSRTNFNFLSNQPGGCIVSSFGVQRSISLQESWLRALSSMPAVLALAYLILRVLRFGRAHIKLRRSLR